MDQLKKQLAPVIKHSFWIMCAGILLVTLGSWWYSTGKLDEEKQQQLTAIAGAFQGVESIQTSQPKHPNASTAEGMDALISNVANEVAAGWQLQYDRQADVLVWPPSFDQEFHAAVNDLRPIEMIPPPPTPFAKELREELRVLYRNYIEGDIPALAKTIGANWVAKSAPVSAGSGSDASGYGSGSADYGASGFGAPGSDAYSSDYGSGSYGSSGYGSGQAQAVDASIVQWSPQNQQELLTTHFSFISREAPPSTLEMLYAQEDFWVLQNIMDIIAATNGDAAARHEAVIKQIDFIRIGRSARGLAGNISPVGGAAAAGGYGSADMAMMSGSTDTTGSSGATSYGAQPGSSATPDMMSGSSGYGMGVMASTDPAEGRYVDPTYQMLPATKLRAALTSTAAEDALLAVAKRMPVRIRVKMDQRRMNRLLAECGNAKLPLEVRQVRINRPPAPVGGTGGGYGGYGGGGGYDPASGGGGYDTASTGDMYGSGYGGDYGSGYDMASSDSSSYGSDMYGGGYGSGFGMMPGATTGRAMVKGSLVSDASVDPHIIDVELYGIVYIYNPVNKAQLGLETPAAESTVAAPVADPATVSSEPVTPESGAVPTTPTSAAPGETAPTDAAPATTTEAPAVQPPATTETTTTTSTPSTPVSGLAVPVIATP